MLVKAAKEKIEQYMNFACSLAMDKTKSGYPLWSDGVSSREEFEDCVWKSFNSENRDILLFVANGAVEGWIQFFCIEEERYLQTDGFLINHHTEQALTEFLEYAGAHFAGYDLYLGFPKRNAAAIAAMQKRDCRLLEESYHDIYIFDGSSMQVETDGIVRVTEDNFSIFREIHRTEPETYWSTERIFRALDEWLIYLKFRDNAAAGYICVRNGEIFDLGYRDNKFDEAVYKALVKIILRDLQASGCKHLIFFNDEESQSAALELGFICVGKYVLYLKSV